MVANNEITAAPFGRRLGALAIDCVLAALVALLFTWPKPPGIISAGVLFFFYVFFVGLFAQTPGMKLLGLACVRYETGKAIGIPRGALRALLLQLVVPAVFLDKNGRGLHDRAVDSIVVKTRKQN